MKIPHPCWNDFFMQSQLHCGQTRIVENSYILLLTWHMKRCNWNMKYDIGDQGFNHTPDWSFLLHRDRGHQINHDSWSKCLFQMERLDYVSEKLRYWSYTYLFVWPCGNTYIFLWLIYTQHRQLSFCKIQTELANLSNLPNSVKIKNPLNISKLTF